MLFKGAVSIRIKGTVRRKPDCRVLLLYSLPFLGKFSVRLGSGLGSGLTVLVFTTSQVVAEPALSAVRD